MVGECQTYLPYHYILYQDHLDQSPNANRCLCNALGFHRQKLKLARILQHTYASVEIYRGLPLPSGTPVFMRRSSLLHFLCLSFLTHVHYFPRQYLSLPHQVHLAVCHSALRIFAGKSPFVCPQHSLPVSLSLHLHVCGTPLAST